MEKYLLTHEPLANMNTFVLAYLGSNPTIDLMHNESDAGVYGLYQCSQAPSQAIGVLEVLPYSGDWCLQRYTTIGASSTTWQRCYYSGTT